MFIVAEVGQAHDGSLGILHSYIDAIAASGADAVKFQTHIAEAESSEFEPFRVNFSYADRTRMAYWRRMEFTEEQWRGIKSHCDQVGLEFMSTPFSVAAVDLLEKIGPRRYKVGSGEVSNRLLLRHLARTGKEIILSSGMSSYEELDSAVEYIRSFGNAITILQCTTEYPVAPENVGLNVISELKARYGVRVGLSDHSGNIYHALAATALGAEVLEVHVVFDKRMFGPDTKASITLDDLKRLVEGARSIEASLRSPVDKNDTSRFDASKRIFGKSLAVNRNMRKGERIAFEDLEAKKPAGLGIPPSAFESVVGRTLTTDLQRWSFLKAEHLA